MNSSNKNSHQEDIIRIKEFLHLDYWENVEKELIPVRKMTDKHIINAIFLFKKVVLEGKVLPERRLEMIKSLIREANRRSLNLKKIGSLKVFLQEN